MNELFDFIKDNGGYAGAASVLGLAVLSLLYFAQAREVKRLREWAGRAPERDAELQQRVMAGQAARAAAQPAAVPRQPVRQPGAPQTAAAQQQATAKPAPANGQTQQQPAVPAAGAAAAAGAAGAAGAAAAQPGAPVKPGAEDTKPDGDEPAKPAEGDTAEGSKPPAAAPTTPAPTAPAAGATPADTPSPTPIPPPRTPAAGRPAARPAPRPAPSPAALRQSGAGTRQSRPSDVSTQRVGRSVPYGTIAVAIVGLIVVVLAAVLLFGGGDDTGGGGGNDPVATTPETTTPQETPPAEEETPPEPRSPSEVNVAVLNGTTVGGLAATTAQQLQGADYNVSKVTNAVDQNRSATEVRYANGYREDALKIAETIESGADAVEGGGIDANLRTVAGDGARVVVVVGSDKQNPQQSGTG